LVDYLLIFLTAFGAATILPFYSEVLVVAHLLNHPASWIVVWLVASIGNTLGSGVNWWLGRHLLRFRNRRWFPFKEGKLGYAQKWYQKYGVWSLLLAWAPIGGDALTFIAGAMKVRFDIFLILTFIGKSIRYLVVIYLTLNTF